MAVDAQEVVMSMDPTVDVAPTAVFNSVAQFEMDNPPPQIAHNVNAPPNMSMSFQTVASFQETLIQEHGPQEVTVVYNQELMDGIVTAGITLPDMAPNMMPEDPNMAASDTLFGALCSVTEELSDRVSQTSSAAGMKQVEEASLELQVQPPAPAVSNTFSFA